MKYRPFGRTGWQVSEISFGAWAIGGSWGQVSEADAIDALHAAIDHGVNFIDTADVYGDGCSERLISQVLKDRSEEIVVVTKAGRRLDPRGEDHRRSCRVPGGGRLGHREDPLRGGRG